MKHRLDSPSMFAGSERLRTIQVTTRFLVVGILLVGTAAVAWLSIGVSPGPDRPGFRSSTSGDDHRSVTSERPSSANDAHPAKDVSPSSDPPSTTPTPKPSATTPSPTPTAESSSDAPTSPRDRPSRANGSPPATPPGKDK
jgi:hypothetical protein